MAKKESLRQKLFPTKVETENKVKTYFQNVERAGKQREALERKLGRIVETVPVLGSRTRVVSTRVLNQVIDELRANNKGASKPQKPTPLPKRGPKP